MQHLHIATVCKTARVSREDGALLRRQIEAVWRLPGPVVLDFTGVRIASVSFFDEALGLLAHEHSLDELKQHVRVENISPADRALLNQVVFSRSKERHSEPATSAE